MAEGGCFPAILGSDEVFTLECSPCKEDGTVIEGVAFCVDCSEYLCHTCLQYHKKNKASKGHKILDGNHLPPASQIRRNASRGANKYCDIHTTNTVTFFCKSHEQLICDLCKKITHRKCSDVTGIDEVCRGFHGSDKATNLLKDFSMLIKELKVLQQERKQDLDQLSQYAETELGKIGTLRKELNELLDRLEREIKQQITETMEKSTKEIIDHIDSLDNAIGTLEKDRGRLTEADNTGDDQAMFFASKEVNLQPMQTFYEDIKQEGSTFEMMFIPDKQITDLLDSLKEFGKLDIRTAIRRQRKGSLKSKNVVKKGEYSVREEDDTEVNWITCAAAINEKQLLLCDFTNKKLKLIDEKYVVLSSIKLPGKPWNVAVICEKEAVVSLLELKKIQFISLQPHMMLGGTVDTGGNVHGLAVRGRTLYVSCCDPGYILVCDLEGTVQRRIEGMAGRVQLFKGPSYIAVDTSYRLYVSDNQNKAVICLSDEDETTYTYRDEDLKYPRQITVDADKYVYVVGMDSNSVTIITPEGKKFRTLIGSEDGLKYPYALAYRSCDKTIVVGMREKILHYTFM